MIISKISSFKNGMIQILLNQLNILIRGEQVKYLMYIEQGCKTTAALTPTGTGRKYLKGLDIKFINQLIDYCNHVVQYYHMIKQGMYIKSIFFL